MNRRGFCRTAAGLLGVSALSGCAQFDAGNGGRGYDLSLEPVGPGGLAGAAALGPDDYSPRQRRLLADAVDGAARVYGHRPIDDGEYVVYEGAYYRISVEETGEKTHARPTLSGEYVSADEAGEAVEITRYDDGDVPAVKFAVATADESGEFHVLHRRPNETGLLPEPEHEYLKYRERYVRLAVEERTVTETEYTYTTEQVATSDAEFGEYVSDAVVRATFRPANLSAGQEELLGEAIDSGHSEVTPISEEFRSLLERLGEDGELPGGSLDTYVRYDGSYYRATVTVSVP